LVGGREPKNAPLIWYFVEPMTGIEPAYSAWEAISTLEQLSDNAS
jgi:hypothetical protein